MSSELAQLWEGAGGQVPPNADVVPFESLLAGPKAIAVGVMYPGEHCDDGVPLIKVGDINGGRIPAEPKFKVSQAVNTEYQRTQLRGDELLITLVGEPGACVVATSAMKGWNPARAIAVARLKDPSLRTYVKAVLESRPGKHLIDSVLNTTVQKTLNLKDIRQLPVPLPARSVVDAVSQVVDALDDRITLLRETNATLEAIAQAMFKSWFVDFDPVRAKMAGRAPEGMDEATAALFPDTLQETELGLVPKGWAAARLADAVESIFSGGTPDTRRPEFWGGGIPWFSSGETRNTVVIQTEKTITPAGVDGSSTRAAMPGDVLIASAGQGHTRGQTSYCGIDCFINQSVVAVRAGKKSKASWLFFNLRRRYDEMRNLSDSHSSRGSLTTKLLAGMPVVVPSPGVLTAFDDVVSALISSVISNELNADTLASLRDSILPRLISGQLRLPEVQAQLEPHLS